MDAGGYGISWNDELELEAEEIWEEGTETGTRTGGGDGYETENRICTGRTEMNCVAKVWSFPVQETGFVLE